MTPAPLDKFRSAMRAPWLVPSILDPYFVSKPSLIWNEFLRLSCLKPNGADWIGLNDGSFPKCLAKMQNNLWIALAVTPSKA